MTGMPREVPKRRSGFGRNWCGPLPRSERAPELGHAMAAADADTYFRDIPSAWCTSFAVRTSRSWPWPTVVAVPAIGGRASDQPSNFRMQRPALRAAADPARSAAMR
jgi:hypothetical protein